MPRRPLHPGASHGSRCLGNVVIPKIVHTAERQGVGGDPATADFVRQLAHEAKRRPNTACGAHSPNERLKARGSAVP